MKRVTPSLGESRSVRRFAWFPVNVFHEEEVFRVWLDYYYKSQVYVQGTYSNNACLDQALCDGYWQTFEHTWVQQ